MARRRAVYLRATGGRTFGRPVAGTISPYLLTGFCACGCCEGSLVVRTQPHGHRREPRFECWHYRTRGRRVCWNRYQPPMAALEAVILDTIDAELRRPRLFQRVVARALAILDAEAPVADDVSAEVAALDGEMRRLTELAAAAGDVAVVGEALRVRQARRDALTKRQARAAAAQRRHSPTADAVAAALSARLADWRGLLRRNVAEARPVLDALLAGRVMVTPRRAREDAPVHAFDVRIKLSTGRMLAGLVPCPQAGTSPTGDDCPGTWDGLETLTVQLST
jgi:hypothetical protein